MIPSPDPPDPPDPVHGLPLGTSPTRAGGQDDVSSKQTPSNYLPNICNSKKTLPIYYQTHSIIEALTNSMQALVPIQCTN